MKTFFRHLVTLSLLLIACCLTAAEPMDAFEEELRLWMTLQREGRDSRQAWEAEQALLQDEIRLLQATQENLQKQLHSTRDAADNVAQQADEAQREAASRIQGLEPSLQAMTKAIEHLDAWQRQLPPPLRQLLEPAMAAIPPATPANQAQRFRATLDALAAARDIAGKLHVAGMIITDDNGAERQMQVLFVGVAVAYAVAPDSSHAAFGRPEPSGWRWVAANDHAPAIQAAIGMVRDREPAHFLSLPLSLTAPADVTP